MKLAKSFSATILTLLVYGCSHPIEIFGEGDVTSASGKRGCTLEQFQASAESCTKNTVIGDYYETYYATSREGYAFDGWENCAQQFPECTIDVTASMVQPFWGQTTPPLRAAFVPVPRRYLDSLRFTGRLETCVVKGIPELHCEQLRDPEHIVQVSMDFQPDNDYISVSTRTTDRAGNHVGGSAFSAYGPVIYKRVWDTGFEVVGIDAVFDAGGQTFFHVYLDKGVWSAV